MESTSNAGLEKLPVMKPRQVIEHFGQKVGGAEPGKVLVESGDFIAMLTAVGGFKLGQQALLSYSSARIGLIEPPVKVDGKVCFVFPDQFDRLGIVLTLRQAYHLPLNAIRDLLKHYPHEQYHLIMERKLTLSDLLDLAKMIKAGYGLGDLTMAKACDMMLEDVLPSSKALSAAVEPGEALRKLQEKVILGRLDEMKAWVSSGRWQEFLKRESAQDFKDLAVKQLLQKKILTKVAAKRARHISRKTGK
jgi:DNA-binding transcriptional MerR regulator